MDRGANMFKMKKVFILYARFGDGHWQAASALRHSFEKQGNTEVLLIDLLAESHPVINDISRFVYKKSSHVLPQVYGWVYEATKGMKSHSAFATWLHSFGTLALQKLIQYEKPDAIIHTFPLLVLPNITQRVGRKILMFNVVTDFDLHQRWVHPNVDKYYVATEDIEKQLYALGVSPDRVAATGIPIRPSFSALAAKGAYSYGGVTPHKPIVLVMAVASATSSDTARLCSKLVARCDVQVILVCGHNKHAERSLTEHFVKDNNISVLGYVNRIDELMAISSCIVTKPGGLTLSEAIMAQLPVFIYRPVPGQELNNARYLENKGAAVISHSIGHLAGAIAELLTKPGRQSEMKRALRFLRKKAASDTIVLDITRQLHIMEETSPLEVR